MKHALFGIGSGVCADPQVAARVACAAEQAGLESLWTGEHVVLPDPREPPSPAPPHMPMLHPSTVLSYVAAVTSKIRLGTGITLIAQRNPVVLAKEMASLDVVSNGRLILGIGAGYLHQEFAALGIPFQERGARTDEAIEVLRELWTAEKPRFSGRFTRFSNIQSRPQPIQKGGPPIVVGGTSDSAYRRAIVQCQGWYGFAMDVEATRKSLAALKAVAAQRARPAALGKLEISITPRTAPEASVSEAYAAEGVDRLIWLTPQTEADTLRMIERLAIIAGV